MTCFRLAKRPFFHINILQRYCLNIFYARKFVNNVNYFRFLKNFILNVRYFVTIFLEIYLDKTYFLEFTKYNYFLDERKRTGGVILSKLLSNNCSIYTLKLSSQQKLIIFNSGEESYKLLLQCQVWAKKHNMGHFPSAIEVILYLLI